MPRAQMSAFALGGGGWAHGGGGGRWKGGGGGCTVSGWQGPARARSTCSSKPSFNTQNQCVRLGGRAAAHGLADGVAVHAVPASGCDKNAVRECTQNDTQLQRVQLGHSRSDRPRAVAEIRDLNQAVAAQEHVAGLEVAVDGVLLFVQEPQAVQHLVREALEGGLGESGGRGIW